MFRNEKYTVCQCDIMFQHKLRTKLWRSTCVLEKVRSWMLCLGLDTSHHGRYSGPGQFIAEARRHGQEPRCITSDTQEMNMAMLMHALRRLGSVSRMPLLHVTYVCQSRRTLHGVYSSLQTVELFSTGALRYECFLLMDGDMLMRHDVTKCVAPRHDVTRFGVTTDDDVTKFGLTGRSGRYDNPVIM